MPNRLPLSRAFCVVTLALASLPLACGSSGTSPEPFASDGGGAGSTDGASLGDAGNGGSGADAGGNPGNLGPIVDASLDAAACTHLNIGLLGTTGANPSSNFTAWLVSSGTSVTTLQTSTTDPLTAAELAPFDVVILDELVRDYTTAEAAIFATWVQGGGGVVSMSGFSNDTTVDWHANSLLAPLGVGYAGALLSGPVTQFALHPITTGLTSVTFNGGYTVADLGGASTRVPIAYLPAGPGAAPGPIAGVAITMGLGHAFVWGDEWIEFDSEWSTIPEIKQLWVQVFGWLAPPSKCAITPPK